MAAYLSVERADGLATITIQNPPLNVLSHAVFQELDETFQELADDQKVIAVLITGGGEKAFVAGADIKEFPQMMGSPSMKEQVMETHAVLSRIEQFPKPTIAVLNGLTLGGGCELALCCDIRVAEAHVKVGLPEIALGLFPGGGGTQRLPRLIGTAKAKELMFTGEPVQAEEARELGLVNHVVPSGEGLKQAKALATKMTTHSLVSLSRIKQAVNDGMDKDIQAALEWEADLFAEVFQSEDIKEGVQAFIEKRKPSFVHR
ncbi:enoyl-CoA hydratase [Shouchella shacheensis]|uniref:enoyl-CoA hydratase n=1 Tax=Shouchella shacheensis TaxID=1649580 RepID=UPI000740174A|nr:enoyl-CoA hydratase [Shouchella shacheensis]